MQSQIMCIITTCPHFQIGEKEFLGSISELQMCNQSEKSQIF